MSISFGAEAEFQSANGVSYISAATLSATAFVVAYSNDPDGHGVARVGTVNGASITFGAAAEFSTNIIDYVSAAALSTTKFFVAFRNSSGGNYGTAIVGTVSGTDITYGAATEFLSVNGAVNISAAALSSTAFVVAYENSSSVHGAAKVGTVTGTSIAFGTEAEFLSTGAAANISATALNSSQFIVVYRDTADSGHGTAKVGTVSGTSITFGAEAEFLSGSSYNSTAAALSATAFVVAYQDAADANHGTAKIGTVSGTSIAFGAETEFQSSGAASWISIAVTSATAFVLAYRDDPNSSHGTARVGTVSGTTITFGARAEFLSANGTNYISAIVLAADKFVVAYQDNADSGHGTTKVGTISDPDISFGAETEFLSDSAVYISAAAISATAFVVAYRKPYPLHAAARVGTVSGTAITFGTETEFVGSDGANDISVAALSATAFVVAYNDNGFAYGAAKVGTISGTSITFGAEAAFQSNFTGADSISAAALSATAFIVAYRDVSGPLYGHGVAKVGTVSGTAIAFGAAKEFLSVNGAYPISCAALSSMAFVVAYRDTADSGHGTAKVGTVSGTDITFGAEAEFLSANGASAISCAALSSTAFVVAYVNDADSYHGAARVGTVGGTAITFGAAAGFLPDGYANSVSASALSATMFIVMCEDLIDYGRGEAWVGTISGTTIAFGAKSEFLSGGGADFNSAAALSGAQIIVAYRDNSDSNHGTAKVGLLSVNVTIDATDVVALADATVRMVGIPASDSVTLVDTAVRMVGIHASDSVALTDEIAVAYSHAVAVASDPSGAPVSASADANGDGDGTTPFSRRYADGAGVALAAPAKSGNRAFLEWRDGGGNTLSSSRALGVTVSAAETYTAHYEFTGDSADDYLVASP